MELGEGGIEFAEYCQEWSFDVKDRNKTVPHRTIIGKDSSVEFGLARRLDGS